MKDKDEVIDDIITFIGISCGVIFVVGLVCVVIKITWDVWPPK